jgi:multicomponent Na+:H+ antiporter subunit D
VTQRLSGTFELKRMGGLYQKFPGISVLFLLSALSLAGLPPLSGFFAKFMLVSAGLKTGNYVIVAVALAVSILTLFSMMKIWAEVFWKDDPAGNPAKNSSGDPADKQTGSRIENSESGKNRFCFFMTIVPVIILSMMALFMGLAAEPFMKITGLIADDLLNPSVYIHAVLGQ